MSYCGGKGKISSRSSLTPLLVYLETALSNLILAEVLEAWGFFVPVQQL